MSKTCGLALMLFFVLSACQDDSKSGDTAPVQQDTDKKEIKTSAPRTYADPSKVFTRENRKAYAIITADLWHFNFALSVTDTPEDNIYEGYWLDFEDDFSYVKGYYDKVIAKGEYDYDNDSKILEMIPTEGDDEPNQWKIKTNGEVIILVGTSKYGNNATQIKLVREKNPPVKRN